MSEDILFVEKKQAHLHVLPFIILNLGGEMVYILDQRLRSQNVAADRSQKVLQDIVKTMFSKKFMSEVFKAQPMFSLVETRQIFVRLAHSSIMRLNETSMQKLFDLMLMGIKMQLIQTCFSEEMVHVTMRHMETMSKMVESGTEAHKLIQSCKASFVLMANQLNAYDFMVIKQQVFKFFQDKHIKVSLFIQDKIQDIDGTIFLNFVGQNPIYTPVGYKPGTVKILTPASSHDKAASKFILEKEIKLPHSDKVSDNEQETRVEGTTQPWLGNNLYAADREKPRIPWKPDDAKSKASAADEKRKMAEKLQQAKEEQKRQADEEQMEEKMLKENSGASKEFNALADLLFKSEEQKEDNFKLNLFPQQPTESQASVAGISGDDPNVVHIDLAANKEEQKQKVQSIAKDLGEMELTGDQQLDGDDMLDLMDNY